jgi:hypothetical protein
MSEKKVVVVSSPDELTSARSRRDFLRMMGVGGAIVFLPSVLTSCSSDDDAVTNPGSGTGATVTIDFSKGDIAVLQFAYALEQLEADFYTNVVANFSGSDMTAADQAVLADVRNHEVIHRDFFKAALGSNASFSLTTTYGSLDFKSRASVLAAARTFEDIGVAAYNGAAQYLTDVNNLGVAGKIVSVEARHASAIRDLLNPRQNSANGFAPTSFDDAFSPAKVRSAAQAYVVQNIAFSNAPTTFVQGPNGNG